MGAGHIARACRSLASGVITADRHAAAIVPPWVQACPSPATFDIVARQIRLDPGSHFMQHFLAELQRRKDLLLASAYVVGGWPDRCRAKGEDDFECS